MYPCFSKEEALAVISVVIDIALADNRLDPNEDQFVGVLATKMGLSKLEVRNAQKLQPNVVAPTLSRMTYDKRKLVTFMLLATSAVDGFSSRTELAAVMMICANCNLVNPNDLEVSPERVAREVKKWLDS